jgi:hypothetical protein
MAEGGNWHFVAGQGRMYPADAINLGNTAVWGLIGGVNPEHYGTLYSANLGAAVMRLQDDIKPKVRFSLAPNGWTKDGNARVQALADDDGADPLGPRPGLGVYRAEVNTYREDGQLTRWVDAPGHGCERARCPRTRTTDVTASQIGEGQREVFLYASDAAGNWSDAGVQRTVSYDASGPQLEEPKGPLWERRNRTDDVRREGMYTDTASVTLTARDGSLASNFTRRSGARRIDVTVRNALGSLVVNSPDPNPRSCPDSSCTHERTFDFNASQLPDGDYTVAAKAEDQAGNESPPRQWIVTVDRAGDVVHAAVFDEDVRPGGELRDEWAQVRTQNARTDDWNVLRTLRVESCEGRPAGCLTRRTRTLSPDSETLRDDDHYRVTRGASANDERLRSSSWLLEPANSSLGSPVATGPIVDVLEIDQRPPPAATQYELFERRYSVIVDEREVERIERLWVSTGARLPIARELEEAGRKQRQVASYDRSRRQASEYPGDWFAVPAPASGTQEMEQLPDSQPPSEEGGEVPRSAPVLRPQERRGLRWRPSRQPGHRRQRRRLRLSGEHRRESRARTSRWPRRDASSGRSVRCDTCQRLCRGHA